MIKKHKSIKNKNVSKDLLIMQCFDFVYAGKAHVFIHIRYDKYELVVTGVHIVEDIYIFSPNYKSRYLFDKLYTAIRAFNIVVGILVNGSMDWYSPDLFETRELYNELFIKD